MSSSRNFRSVGRSPEASKAAANCNDQGDPGDHDTAKLVFAHAREEFLAHGYAAARFERIASSAGIAPVVLDRLFPTKVDLLRAMIAHTLDQFLERMATAVNERDLTTVLELILLDCARLALDDNVIAFTRMVFTEREQFPEIADACYQEGILRVPVTLAAWLAWHRDCGNMHIDDPNEAASLLLGMMNFELHRDAMLGRSAPTEQALRKRAHACAIMFLNGCAAPKAP